MVFTIIFPEMLTGLAGEQWRSARQSREDFRRLQREGPSATSETQDLESQHKRRRQRSVTQVQSNPWTLRHAFFADMGGFLVEFPDHQTLAVNAHQLFYLVEKGYLDYPNVTYRQIWDRNKADGFARAVSLIQITWFVVQGITRAWEHLAITSIELSTLAMIFCTVNTMFFWQYKPLDAETPIVLQCPTLLSTIYARDSAADETASRNQPLDFVTKQATGLTMVQPFCLAVTACFDWRRNQGISDPDLIPNTDTFPPRGLSMVDIIYGVLFTQAYLAIHLAGWNFVFPTPTEQLLWRLCSLILIGLVILYLAGLAFGTPAAGWLALKFFHTEGIKTITGWAELLPRGVALAFYLPMILAYGLARTYILVEGFFGLRSLPVTAFLNVDWTQFFPHV